MRSVLLATALTSLLPLTAHAQSYLAVNKLTVVPLSATDFEVIESRGEGARGMWCAAASFAKDRLRTPNNAPLYVKSARTNAVSVKGRKGVVFSTSARGLTPKSSVSVSVRQTGSALPLHHAFQFCKDYLIELEDLL